MELFRIGLEDVLEAPVDVYCKTCGLSKGTYTSAATCENFHKDDPTEFGHNTCNAVPVPQTSEGLTRLQHSGRVGVGGIRALK